MKKSPQTVKLEDMLRSSHLVAGGFMGADDRSFIEIIETDDAELVKMGYSLKDLADRMDTITEIAKKSLGNWAELDEKRLAMISEAKGLLVCPWPHPGKFTKTVTTVKLKNSDETISWTDLNIHLIAEHGFFEGKGSPFRIEPKKLIKIIF